ncbi:MAG TPA: o-succinylbenzoate synthase [Anaerolineales bacterium]|nr:o-succinylbenzoate synthase [Anaerolineales bacterium]
MKIDTITLHHLSMPLVSPFETSFGRATRRECLVVELQSEGLTAWGECPADADPGYSYETVGTARHILKDFIAPLVLGQDIESPGTYRERVAHIRGHPMAKSGLEMALWDLQGRRDGRSLRRMLGGTRGVVEVGVSIGLQAGPDALVETVSGYLQNGYHRVKLKIKPGRDIGDVRAVRAAFPTLRLQVDANSAYVLGGGDPRRDAGALLPLDDLNLLLIEQPLAEDDLWDHHKLQRRFRTPLCLDESITSPRDARQALEMEACRVINIKQSRVGGISNALEIHDLCRAMGVPVWCGGMLETGIGRAANLGLASLENFSLPGDISATDRYYDRDITRERFTLNTDSTIDVPDRPGLGVEVDREVLQQYTLSRSVC